MKNKIDMLIVGVVCGVVGALMGIVISAGVSQINFEQQVTQARFDTCIELGGFYSGELSSEDMTALALGCQLFSERTQP